MNLNGIHQESCEIFPVLANYQFEFLKDVGLILTTTNQEAHHDFVKEKSLHSDILHFMRIRFKAAHFLVIAGINKEIWKENPSGWSQNTQHTSGFKLSAPILWATEIPNSRPVQKSSAIQEILSSSESKELNDSNRLVKFKEQIIKTKLPKIERFKPSLLSDRKAQIFDFNNGLSIHHYSAKIEDYDFELKAAIALEANRWNLWYFSEKDCIFVFLVSTSTSQEEINTALITDSIILKDPNSNDLEILRKIPFSSVGNRDDFY